MTEVRLLTYDPGHCHAALVQKEMYPGVSPTCHVYAPLGPDLLAHLGRIAAFNARKASPADWRVELHSCPSPLERMITEKPGNVVVLSGRNRHKIDAIHASLRAGLHVLADKPWVIATEDLWKLRSALEHARGHDLIALDIMTERHEVTSQLQRELVRDSEIFGERDPGSPERPGVFVETEHFLCKTVSGAPLRRPVWFFDTQQQGEGLSDVGTHAVDLVAWVLFPESGVSIDDIELVKAGRMPTILSKADFQKVTGEADFPDFLRGSIESSHLLFQCNTTLLYRINGVYVWLNIAWGFEARPGCGDRHLMQVRGTRSSIEVRQGEPEQFIPEVYVVPNRAEDAPVVKQALKRRLAQIQGGYPGVGMEEMGGSFRLTVPAEFRVGHEAHFGAVFRQFLGYLHSPSSLPAWEHANMLAKYHVTTHGVRLARASG
jgi:predicted dehydrogenase